MEIQTIPTATGLADHRSAQILHVKFGRVLRVRRFQMHMVELKGHLTSPPVRELCRMTLHDAAHGEHRLRYGACQGRSCAMPAVCPDAPTPVSYCLAAIRSSDHWAFWQAGDPALMVTDTAMFR